MHPEANHAANSKYTRPVLFVTPATTVESDMEKHLPAGKRQACAITKQNQQFVCGLWAAGWVQWHLDRSLVNNDGCSALGFVIYGEVCLFRPCKLRRLVSPKIGDRSEYESFPFVQCPKRYAPMSLGSVGTRSSIALINQWDLEHLWSQLYIYIFASLAQEAMPIVRKPQIDKNK